MTLAQGQKISPENTTQSKDSLGGPRRISKSAYKLNGGMRKQSKKKSKENITYITVPESVMLGFNPRTQMPWGFDGCGDGNAKFIMPHGYEFDHVLEEKIEDLNMVEKARLGLANFSSVALFGIMVYLCITWGNMLMPMTIMVIIADVVTVLIFIPIILSVRFTLKAIEVRRYVNRLDEQLHDEESGKVLGAVHFEKIEYGRIEVWNHPFVGHRTGFTQRTAIAVELFLDNPEVVAASKQKAEMQALAAARKASQEENEAKSGRKKIDWASVATPGQEINQVMDFLQNIHLGRLAPTIRRARMTFERMEKLTDLEWRDLGVDRTEMKIIRAGLDKRAEEMGYDWRNATKTNSKTSMDYENRRDSSKSIQSGIF